MGDFNAKIERINTGYEEILGNQEIYTRPLATNDKPNRPCVYWKEIKTISLKREADHHLLVARIKLKLKRHYTEQTSQRLYYNT